MEEMGRFNDELVKAGIMKPGDCDGLKPSSHGKRVAFDGPAGRSLTGLSAEPASWLPATGSGRSRTWTRQSPG